MDDLRSSYSTRAASLTPERASVETDLPSASLPGVLRLSQVAFQKADETADVGEETRSTLPRKVEDALCHIRAVSKSWMCCEVSSEGTPCGHGVLVLPSGVVVQGTFDGGASRIQDALVNVPGVFRGTGSIVDGDFEGHVEIQQEEGRYKGHVRRGVPAGAGTWTGNDGVQYNGQWRNGMRHGDGEQHYDELSCYTGQWENDERHGKGRTVAPDYVYVGQYRCGLRHGPGVLSARCDAVQDFQVRYDNGESRECVPALQAEVERLGAIVESQNLQNASARTAAAGGSASCAVCYTAPISVVLRPCGHATTCAGCERRLRSMPGIAKCPVCRGAIRASEKIIIHGAG